MRKAKAQNSQRKMLPFPLLSAPPFPMNCPTEVLNPRRNQTFMVSSRSCEPTIRHQLLNTGEVALEAPME